MLLLAAVMLWSASISAALVLIVLNWRQWRRQVILNALLQDICVRAFMLRHTQIWVPWSDMTGIGFEVRPVPGHNVRPAEPPRRNP